MNIDRGSALACCPCRCWACCWRKPGPMRVVRKPPWPKDAENTIRRYVQEHDNHCAESERTWSSPKATTSTKEHVEQVFGAHLTIETATTATTE